MINPTYQVKGWSDNFEVAKSKTYKNKNICQMPMKKGIGYRRLVRAENGPAMFGAWCAMVQTLSAHQPPREGFVTHDGTPDGKPYSPGDLELLTDISADVFSRLLIIAASQDVEWLDLVSAGDTTGIPDGYHKDSSVSLHSNSNLNSNLNLNPNTNINSEKPSGGAARRSSSPKKRKSYDEDFDEVWAAFGKYGSKPKAAKYWKLLSDDDRANVLFAIPPYLDVVKAGRSKKQFEGWINPENELWRNDWNAVLADMTAPIPARKVEDAYHNSDRKSLLG